MEKALSQNPTGNSLKATRILEINPNHELFNAIENKDIKYIFSGHIHTGTHRVTEYKGKKMVNVSIKDEDYNLSYYPQIFEI